MIQCAHKKNKKDTSSGERAATMEPTLHILLMHARSDSSLYLLNFMLSGKAVDATLGAVLAVTNSVVVDPPSLLALVSSSPAGFGGTNMTDELAPTVPRISVPMPEKAWVIDADVELPVRNAATSQVQHRRRLQVKRGCAYVIQVQARR
jgi:hypothetical protein